MRAVPIKVSEPRAVMTIFGPAVIEGPFADDFTTLKWQFKDHRDGETARFRACGIEAYVADCDGDSSYWTLIDRRTKTKIAEGSDYGFEPNHFFQCLAEAEAALRAEVSRRKAAFR